MAVAQTAQAVGAARALEPDLVLMDVRMPALGGIAAASQIKAARPSTLVVLISTAHPRRAFPSKRMTALADAAIWKSELEPRLLDQKSGCDTETAARHHPDHDRLRHPARGVGDRGRASRCLQRDAGATVVDVCVLTVTAWRKTLLASLRVRPLVEPSRLCQIELPILGPNAGPRRTTAIAVVRWCEVCAGDDRGPEERMP